jgi:hypothetical protein
VQLLEKALADCVRYRCWASESASLEVALGKMVIRADPRRAEALLLSARTKYARKGLVERVAELDATVAELKTATGKP